MIKKAIEHIIYAFECIWEFLTDHIIGVFLIFGFLCFFIFVVSLTAAIDQSAKDYAKCREQGIAVDICITRGY